MREYFLNEVVYPPPSIKNRGDKVAMARVFAFTLSEIMIVLGIIGIIAVLTIPALLNNINEADTKAQWKVIYSEVEQAYRSILADAGGDITGHFGTKADMQNAFAEKMIYSKRCDVGTPTGRCWPRPFTEYNTAPFTTVVGNDPTVFWPELLLSRGASIRFILLSSSCTRTSSYFTYSYCGDIQIDINGPAKGPNFTGKDIFVIYFAKDKVYPEGVFLTPAASGMFLDPETCTSTRKTSGCAAKYLIE